MMHKVVQGDSLMPSVKEECVPGTNMLCNTCVKLLIVGDCLMPNVKEEWVPGTTMLCNMYVKLLIIACCCFTKYIVLCCSRLPPSWA